MQFKKAPQSLINGTCLQGYIHTSYRDLVECFGEPHCDGDGYKVDAEWMLRFEDGTVATIYNWKDGKNYCGFEGLDVEDITDWHVGGNSPKAVTRVEEAVNEYLVRVCYKEPKEIPYFGA